MLSDHNIWSQIHKYMEIKHHITKYSMGENEVTNKIIFSDEQKQKTQYTTTFGM